MACRSRSGAFRVSKRPARRSGRQHKPGLGLQEPGRLDERKHRRLYQGHRTPSAKMQCLTSLPALEDEPGDAGRPANRISRLMI